MRTITTPFGGKSVKIHAPGIGEFTREHAFTMWHALIEDGRNVAGLDVETTSHDSKDQLFHWAFRVRTVQFGSADQAWVLRTDDPYQRSVIASVLADARIRFCTHWRYDPIAVWREFGIDITNRWIDTHLLAKIADPLTLDRHEKTKGKLALDLKTLTTTQVGAPELAAWDEKLDQVFDRLWVEAGHQAHKGTKEQKVRNGFNTVPIDNDVFVTYAGLDAIACRQLYPILVRSAQSDPTLLGTETWLAGLMVRQQMRGMRVDRARLQEAYDVAEASCTPPTTRLMELIGLRPTQNVRLLEWFKEHFTFPASHPTTANGNVSIGKDGLKAMCGYELPEDVHNVVLTMLAYTERVNSLTKAKEVMALVDESFDGRLHPRVESLGAITARMTSSAPNIQNYAKEDPTMRATLVPDEGMVLIGADFDTVELRVLAALVQEPSMLATIHAGGDLHQLTADKLGIPRQVAKRVNFLQAYGGGAAKLVESTGIPLAEAETATRSYREAYPEIGTYSRGMEGMPEIRTQTFRRIPVTHWKNFRKGGLTEPAYFRFLNYMIQSSSRDLLVMALHRLAVMGMADMVWVPIHDELILQVPADRVEEFMAKLQEAMRMTFLGVPITATAVALYDEDGTSRWMTCDRAEKIRDAKNELVEVAA
jgi:DNA polymerase-1